MSCPTPHLPPRDPLFIRLPSLWLLAVPFTHHFHSWLRASHTLLPLPGLVSPRSPHCWLCSSFKSTQILLWFLSLKCRNIPHLYHSLSRHLILFFIHSSISESALFIHSLACLSDDCLNFHWEQDSQQALKQGRYSLLLVKGMQMKTGACRRSAVTSRPHGS